MTADDVLPEQLDDDTRRRMTAHFANVPLHRLLGIALVSLGRDSAVFSMPVDDAAFNSSGNLHGGAIATLVDVASGTAAAVGSGFVQGTSTLVTADMHVRYLARPRGDTVTATGRCVRAGRQLIVVETRVTDDEERLVAVADFSSMIVPLRAPLKQASAPTGGPDL